jgi:diguanylate cyclase (GGDEF)-like protein
VDGFGRVGGEEFLILMPGIDADLLRVRIEAVLGAVRKQRPLPDHPDFKYTASVGVGMLRAAEDAVTNLGRIDEALYKAKSMGRDQCVSANERS